MSATRTAGLLLLLLTAGCTATVARHAGEASVGPLMADTSLLSTNKGGAAAPAAAAVVPAQDAPLVPTPQSEAAPPAPPQARETTSAMDKDDSAAPGQNVRAAATAPEARSRGRSDTVVETPRAKTAAKPAVSPATNMPAAKTEPAQPVAAKTEAAHTLDVAALKLRLRETKAIGVFSKLALKNQMDDVLDQFRAAYRGGETRAPVALRQPYEMLVLKVLALLQEGDPALARSVAGSREAIWAILADAEKFRTIT